MALPSWTRDVRVRRAGWLAAYAAVAIVWHTVGCCLALDVETPWITQTMASRAWAHWRQTGELRLPDYRPIDLDDLPDCVPQAAMTSEDQRFYEHHGFDWEAIGDAWTANHARKSHQPVRGGSTISQQVARNVFLWQGRTWVRKGLEAWYTVWLELLVPKHRILELYLDVAETGPMTFGVEAGARHWYGVPASRLTPRQAATIVSLLPAPTRWTPKTDHVREHADWILRHAVDPASP